MRVSTKGQATIPKAVRERLGLRAGSEVVFIETPEGVMVRKAASSDGQRIVDAMLGQGVGRCEFSTEELMELTRGDD